MITTSLGLTNQSVSQSSTSASRLMQSQNTTVGSSIKISSKGQKQMNQFRYGPVRAVQQTMPHSFSSGLNNLQKNVLSNQRRSAAAGAQGHGSSAAGTKGNLLSGSHQKQRPNSSKPAGSSNNANSSGLDLSGLGPVGVDRPNTANNGRPASPGSMLSKS